MARNGVLMRGVLIASALAFTAAPAAVPNAQIVRDPPMTPQNAGNAWNASAAKSGVRRYELRGSDRPAGPNDPRQRSEAFTSRLFEPGRDYRVEVEFRIDRGPPNRAKWLTLIQLQSTFDPGEPGHGPPLAVELKGERMEVMARTAPGRLSRAEDIVATKLFSDSRPLRRGKWHRLRIEFRFDPGGNGRVWIWRDGRQLVAWQGAIGFDDARGAYYKEGVYRATTPERMAISFRRLRIVDRSPAARR